MAELQTACSPSVHAVEVPAARATASTAPAADSGPAHASLSTTPPRVPRPHRGPPLHQVYKQPAPLQTFPYPATNLSNPLSLVHLAITWLGHVLFPPPVEPSVIHTAFWNQDTRTIIVVDEKSMADLWQQGFYGKGSLSRSEPNWLKRGKIRDGAQNGSISEQNTEKRREDRVRAKWERARAEQEALEQKRLDEARAAATAGDTAKTEAEVEASYLATPSADHGRNWVAPVRPIQPVCLTNSQADLVSSRYHDKSSADAFDVINVSAEDSGSSGNIDAECDITHSTITTQLDRPKSVHFSPKVDSTVFLHTDPPSPPRSVSASSLKEDSVVKANGAAFTNESESAVDVKKSAQSMTESVPPVEVTVVNKEHLQLAPEETLFLVFAMGALKVVDIATRVTLSTKDLLLLLRQNSYFPPRPPQGLEPDDPFLLHYAVYHHFRSIGWVPRPGVKFGVDWLLYNRGPVFDHAEYGLLVLPSYNDPHWTAKGRQSPQKSWHWLFGVNRVLSKVYKSLVLVYVDVPLPNQMSHDGHPQDGLAKLLPQYKIREYMVKRWSSNRNRD